MKRDKFFLLKSLHGKRLDNYTLHLGEIKQLKMSGWRGFKLYLQDSLGILSKNPVIRGIYSIGRKKEVKPWMDLEYHEELKFFKREEAKDKFSISSQGFGRMLFQCLGDIIPPGGHLMVSYENRQKIHINTVKSLNIGIPPVVTPLGFLIFISGFQHIKDWYLAEGGFEGPRKIWGEKAPDASWAQTFYEETAKQILQFLKRKPKPSHKELEESADRCSREALGIIKRNYRGNFNIEAY